MGRVRARCAVCAMRCTLWNRLAAVAAVLAVRLRRSSCWGRSAGRLAVTPRVPVVPCPTINNVYVCVMRLHVFVPLCMCVCMRAHRPLPVTVTRLTVQRLGALSLAWRRRLASLRHALTF